MLELTIEQRMQQVKDALGKQARLITDTREALNKIGSSWALLYDEISKLREQLNANKS